MIDIINQQLSEIFFESSGKKDFKDEKEKEDFYFKYMGYYLAQYPEFLHVAKDESVIGYCLGAPSTDKSEFFILQPHLKIFKDLFLKYPAHFHINCHARARGQGVGAGLLAEFELQLQNLEIAGVHLITTPAARNRSFYTRLGYTFEVIRPYEGRELLFMGKKLL